MPPEETAAYLKTLPAIRERCGRVHALAQQGKLQYFDYYPEKEDDVAAFCAGLMKVLPDIYLLLISTKSFPSNPARLRQRFRKGMSRPPHLFTRKKPIFHRRLSQIPPHGRWRHLDAGRSRIAPLIETWASSPNPPDKTEVTRRLLDLFLVSVLLDAGAGSTWAYKEKGTKYARSEGLGVASVHMFVEGFFSGVPGEPCRVDGAPMPMLTHGLVEALTALRAMDQRRASRLSPLSGRRLRCKFRKRTRWSGSTGARGSCTSSPARSPLTQSTSDPRAAPATWSVRAICVSTSHPP